jgi:hypothetical protein
MSKALDENTIRGLRAHADDADINQELQCESREIKDLLSTRTASAGVSLDFQTGSAISRIDHMAFSRCHLTALPQNTAT